MTGRPERTLEHALDSEIAGFARDLRALRADTGLTLRQLAAISFTAPSTLSTATSGTRMPTREVTEAFVLGCGGDPVAWQARREQIAARVRARRGACRIGD